jgi:hypothetical protein
MSLKAILLFSGKPLVGICGKDLTQIVCVDEGVLTVPKLELAIHGERNENL